MRDYIKNEIIENTLTRAYAITLKDCSNNPKRSRIGGSFVWPKDNPLPEDKLFLAQINLSELTNNELLPKTGLLQFFVDNDLSGESLVVYHQIPDLFNVIKTPLNDTPILKPAEIDFSACMEAMSYSDYRFPTNDDQIRDSEEFEGWGTKLLGYPYFCQEDPRGGRKDLAKYDTLLLQIDSEKNYTKWGDSGIANFFINSKALKKGDFSDTYFTWDCV